MCLSWAVAALDPFGPQPSVAIMRRVSSASRARAQSRSRSPVHPGGFRTGPPFPPVPLPVELPDGLRNCVVYLRWLSEHPDCSLAYLWAPHPDFPLGPPEGLQGLCFFLLCIMGYITPEDYQECLRWSRGQLLEPILP